MGNNGKGVFVQAGKPGQTPQAGNKVPKYNGIRVLDAENPSAYGFDVMADGQLGTRVPIAARNKRGGIEGDPGNIYGTIFLGQKLTAAAVEGEGWDSLGQVEPPVPISVPPRQNGTPVVDEAAELHIQDILDKEAAAVAAQGRETHSSTTAPPQSTAQGHMHQAPPPEHYPPAVMRSPAEAPYTGPLVPQAIQVVQQVDRDHEKIGAVFAGPFGSFHGKYLYVHEDKNMLILIYDLEDPVYNPPVGDTELTITCDEQAHKVYFLGVVFDLPFFDCGIQVFFKVD